MNTAPTQASYRTLWRWHFYAGLFILPFMITLAITGGLYVFFSWNLKKVLSDIKVQTILLRTLSVMMGILALGMFYREFNIQYLA